VGGGLVNHLTPTKNQFHSTNKKNTTFHSGEAAVGIAIVSVAESSRMEFVNRIVQAHNALVARGREHGRDACDDRDDWEMTKQDFNLQFSDFQYNYNTASTQFSGDDVIAVGNDIGDDVHDEAQSLTDTGTDVSIRQGSVLGSEGAAGMKEFPSSLAVVDSIIVLW
jgi:hypothetical protein